MYDRIAPPCHGSLRLMTPSHLWSCVNGPERHNRGQESIVYHVANSMVAVPHRTRRVVMCLPNYAACGCTNHTPEAHLETPPIDFHGPHPLATRQIHKFWSLLPKSPPTTSNLSHCLPPRPLVFYRVARRQPCSRHPLTSNLD